MKLKKAVEMIASLGIKGSITSHYFDIDFYDKDIETPEDKDLLPSGGGDERSVVFFFKHQFDDVTTPIGIDNCDGLIDAFSLSSKYRFSDNGKFVTKIGFDIDGAMFNSRLASPQWIQAIKSLLYQGLDSHPFNLDECWDDIMQGRRLTGGDHLIFDDERMMMISKCKSQQYFLKNQIIDRESPDGKRIKFPLRFFSGAYHSEFMDSASGEILENNMIHFSSKDGELELFIVPDYQVTL